MSPIFILIAAIIFGGFAGATANFLLMAPVEDEKRNWQTLLRLAIGGILVAFTIPLFLSLAQSTLVQQILTVSPEQNRYSELLIFVGFCIAASFSSRAFVTNLSQRILADVAKTKEIVKQTREKVDHVEEAVGEALDQATGDSTARSTTQSPNALEADAAPISLNPEQRKTLQAAGRLTMRTATGIARDAGIPRNQVGEILDDLIGKNLVEKTNSPNTGGLRHRITPLGVAVLNKELREGQ
jgi:DNA-binding MarR family transcriptional regulator